MPNSTSFDSPKAARASINEAEVAAAVAAQLHAHDEPAKALRRTRVAIRTVRPHVASDPGAFQLHEWLCTREEVFERAVDRKAQLAHAAGPRPAGLAPEEQPSSKRDDIVSSGNANG